MIVAGPLKRQRTITGNARDIGWHGQEGGDVNDDCQVHILDLTQIAGDFSMERLSLKLSHSVLILLGCCGLVIWVAGPAAAQGAVIWLDPATLNLAPGDTGTLDIRVENVIQLAGAEVNLTFDPALLEVVDADPTAEGVQIAYGDFLSPDFVVRNTADLVTGTVEYSIACMPLDEAVSGGGVLACITFRALAEGETRVTIRSALLADMQRQPITVETDSSVVVVSRSGPSPEVWALIGLVAAAVVAGLIAVAWHFVIER